MFLTSFCLLRPPDWWRILCFTCVFLFWYPDSLSARRLNGTVSEVYQRFGPRLNLSTSFRCFTHPPLNFNFLTEQHIGYLKHPSFWLGYFTYSFHNFTRGGVKKCKLWPKFGYWDAVFLKRNNVSKIWKLRWECQNSFRQFTVLPLNLQDQTVGKLVPIFDPSWPVYPPQIWYRSVLPPDKPGCKNMLNLSDHTKSIWEVGS